MIPNELSREFATREGRKRLLDRYGNSNTLFSGRNADGEMVCVSFDKEAGIVLKTSQQNGWVRVNYYDNDGWPAGETFEERWTE